MKILIGIIFAAFIMNNMVYCDIKLPSEVLDLKEWKITLPINNAQEIKQPDLATYYHEDYFKVNETGDGVVFTAPIDGETTSGSKYPRSELREMTNNGKDKASWSTTKGTHIMEIEQAITHLPDVKQHIVVGQIHDGSDDVIVFRLEKKKLFIELGGTDGPALTTDYELGTKFRVKFVAGNGGVMCFYNGKYVYTYDVKTDGCFFKAGCYTQSNLSKGDVAGAYGENVIYNLNVEHFDTDPMDYAYYEDNEQTTTETTTQETTQDLTNSYIIGDVNNDKELTATDAAGVLAYVLNCDSNTLNNVPMEVADVDSNGEITATDGASILAKVLNDDFNF